MIQKVWKIGNSLAFVIPPNIAEMQGIKPGDMVSIPDDQLTKVNPKKKK